MRQIPNQRLLTCICFLRVISIKYRALLKPLILTIFVTTISVAIKRLTLFTGIVISIGPWQDLPEPHGRDVRFANFSGVLRDALLINTTNIYQHFIRGSLV